MFKTLVFSGFLLILLLFSSVNAIEVFEPDYTVEVYATYSLSKKTISLEIDDFGNLYTTHYPADSIWWITPSGIASEFFTGIDYPRGIVWTGGTDYGDNLYVVDFETFRGDIYRVDFDGSISHFAALSGDGPTPLAVDRTGNYGGYLYVATRGNDCIYRIDYDGRESIFSNFPYSKNGGGPMSIAFDMTGYYGGFMYIANSYDPNVAHLSGIFTIDTEGIEARFADTLVQAEAIAFEKTGAFGGYMFATGRSEFDGQKKLWRIDPDGRATEFASACNNIVFDWDGSMYVSELSPTGDMVIISRISRKYYYADPDHSDYDSFLEMIIPVRSGI